MREKEEPKAVCTIHTGDLKVKIEYNLWLSISSVKQGYKDYPTYSVTDVDAPLRFRLRQLLND